MRIIKLTKNVERALLHGRRARDEKAHRVAARIIADVRKRGDVAIRQWTKKFDGVDLRAGMWVSSRTIEKAREDTAEETRMAMEHAARNIRVVAERQLPREWTLEVEAGVKISQVVRPIEAIGCYVPGGRFSLLSTLLMTVIPAQVAGVKRIVVVSPKPNAELLAAAAMLGVTRIGRIGGAQAIAALAYGTNSIVAVDKIFGPGNRFVTAAKQLVSGDCAIDLPAGPTEAIVLADDGDPAWIAADLLAQAEHAPDAVSFMVTTSRDFADRTQVEIREQLRRLPKTNPAQQSSVRSGAILLAPSMERACEFVNRFAPEHLSLPQNNNDLLQQVQAAGTVFLGPWSAQPFGDYASGSNHVLPTAGWARARGGLSTADFVKCISLQHISETGFARLGQDVQNLARAEGLLAHAKAIEVRR
ncbi:MAG TPA: histidinol dehydrogenase [Candidatus Acidoferrum sp.]|jgi:histidinol dehydrogenase|nr:histidinol dehydrogenase [Candidatus Acidoferrum sp.]